MHNNTEKKIKALISGLIVNDETKTQKLVNDLLESILPEKEETIMHVLIDSFKGETNV